MIHVLNIKKKRLTIMARIEQMLAQVAAKDALPHDARLLELHPRRPVGEEQTQQRQQLAVLAQHWGWHEE